MMRAIRVVPRYIAIVLPPIRDSLLRSDREAIPVMSEASTSGTATSSRSLRKIVPNGAIQSAVKPPHPA